MVFAPQGLQDSAQGFNPGKHPKKRFALRGREITWADASDCYRKGRGYLLGRDTIFPLANNAHQLRQHGSP
jgi:hypothetical protein